MKSKVDDATDRFRSGFNCAQSVFSAYANELGLKEEDALRISTGFGAGMARQQEVCGAVTGAYMVIGSAHGMIDPKDTDAKESTYAGMKDFSQQFSKLHGSISCRELLGCDINTEEGKKAYADANLSATVCLPCVQDACKLLEESGVLEQDSRRKP
jgi:C_GCAxxG_C_C family probable redox protein